MKAKKFIPLLFVAAALSSCEFTEDCDYFGWLRVENNWQGYNDIPSAPDRNYALLYSDSKGYQGECDIVPNLEGVPDTVTARMPMGGARVITFTRPNDANNDGVNDEDPALPVTNMSQNIKFKNLDDFDRATAYVDYYSDDTGFHIAEPGLFYLGQSSTNVKFEDIELVKRADTHNQIPVLQRQITKFLEFRFHVGKDNPSLPNVTGIRTSLSGIATELNLSTGEGVPESAVTCNYMSFKVPGPGDPGYDPENPSSDNLADIQYKYQFTVLDFLGRFDQVDNTRNILTVWAQLDNGEERVRSIDISSYLANFEHLCMVARIDVDVSSDNLNLGVVFSEFETGLWEYYNIGKK